MVLIRQGRETPGNAHVRVSCLGGYTGMDPMTIVHSEFNRNNLCQEGIGEREWMLPSSHVVVSANEGSPAPD